MMKHIIVTRNNPRAAGFDRCDFFRGKWMQYDHNGQVLHAIIPGLKEELENTGGNVSITLSSGRMATAFRNPEAMAITDGLYVVALVPMSDATGDRTIDALRLWTVLIWNGPGIPVKGEKLRQKLVPAWLDKYFTIEQVDAWKLPQGAKTEIWIRPSWNATEMFPELFAKPANTSVPVLKDTKPVEPAKQQEQEVVNDVKEHQATTAKEFSLVPIVDGKPIVRTGFSVRTKWRFFGVDGQEVARGFANESEAEAAMNTYLQDNCLRLPEPVSE